jgi:pyrimidine operon attenuation protein / uracil phosphoribosyltransferase
MNEEKKYILRQEVAARKMRRMAYEILENNTNETHFVLAGIRESGSVIARAMQQLLQEISTATIDLITVSLDKKLPADITLSKNDDFTNKIIILIDDVANSGKTLLYALKPFLAFHPKKIQVLVLVERSHKTFPIKPDYVGLSFSTTPEEHIYVETSGDIIKGAFIV